MPTINLPVTLNDLAALAPSPLPDFVKSAALGDDPGLAKTAFADPGRRALRCDSRGATYAANLVFLARRDLWPAKEALAVEARLDNLNRYWGLGAEVEALRAASAARTKEAGASLADADFAWVRETEGGGRERRLRLTTDAEVHKAAAYVAEYRDAFPLSIRQVMAGKILAKAAALDVALSDDDRDFLERQAGHGVCRPSAAVEQVRLRGYASRDPVVRAKLAAVADRMARDTDWLAPDHLRKAAALVDTIDRASGLVKSAGYGEQIRRPEDVFFEATASAAARERASLVAIDGRLHKRADFARLPLDKLAGVFGPEVVAGLRKGLGPDPDKLAKLAESLPAAELWLLRSLLEASDVATVAGHSARTDLTELADAYTR